MNMSYSHFVVRHKFQAILVMLVLVATVGAATAHDYKAGQLRIGHPWSRATPRGAKVAAGYLTIHNSGTEPDRLLGGSIEAASRVEVHFMTIEGGVMRMGPVGDGLAIAPGATVSLQPNGYHLMFTKLRTSLRKGDMIKGVLTFEKAGDVPVEFEVGEIAAKAPDNGGHGHEHHH